MIPFPLLAIATGRSGGASRPFPSLPFPSGFDFAEIPTRLEGPGLGGKRERSRGGRAPPASHQGKRDLFGGFGRRAPQATWVLLLPLEASLSYPHRMWCAQGRTAPYCSAPARSGCRPVRMDHPLGRDNSPVALHALKQNSTPARSAPCPSTLLCYLSSFYSLYNTVYNNKGNNLLLLPLILQSPSYNYKTAVNEVCCT